MIASVKTKVSTGVPQNEGNKSKTWFSDDDLINAYTEGKETGERTLREKVHQEYETNVSLAQTICENFILQADADFKIKCKAAHLDPTGICDFKAIIVIPSKSFLSLKQFTSLVQLAQHISDKFNKDNFSISFSFMPYTKDLNKDALVADGYHLTYVNG